MECSTHGGGEDEEADRGLACQLFCRLGFRRTGENGASDTEGSNLLGEGSVRTRRKVRFRRVLSKWFGSCLKYGSESEAPKAGEVSNLGNEAISALLGIVQMYGNGRWL